jgi:hypothetical protein
MTQIFVKSSILDDNNIKKNTDNNIKNNTDNNNNNTNIIISVKETPKLIFVYNDLLNTIPLKNIVLNEDISLLTTHVEWRWRFYNINSKQFVVISKKEPNKPRIYMQTNSEWGEQIIDEQYEKYIIKTFYYYNNT